MNTIKRPLKKGFLTAILVFLILLGLLLSLTQYLHYRKILYNRYDYYIENVLNYAAAGIDRDDLAACVRSGKASEGYRELQAYLDGIRRGFDMHYLYCIVPLNTEQRDNMMNVIAGATEYEYLHEPDEIVQLGQLTGEAYSPATAKKYLDAYNSGRLSFFEDFSQWGDDYTGLLPLYDSAGERFAALCMDIDVRAIHSQLRQNTVNTIVLIALLGAAFALVFLRWTKRSITRPLEELEHSAARFASTCLEQRDPDALCMEMPEIRTGNEVEALSHAIRQMSDAVRVYLAGFVYTEDALKRMTVLANKDALTQVRNKTAYDGYMAELEERMRLKPFPAAVLMVDLNNLKHVNDEYGHEKGDAYLKTCCATICAIFAHSPVFRVGGDEFIVVLSGQDYANRAALLQTARAAFDAAAENAELAPWERISVAVGMAEYRPESGESFREVLERADRNMYREKRRMKVER